MHRTRFFRLSAEQSVRIAVWLIMLSAFVSMIGDLGMAAGHWNTSAPPTWIKTVPNENARLAPFDIDAWNIHRGLLQAPSFAQTLRWWNGPWVLGTAYYRPLSSLVFWIDWKIFGDAEVRWIASAALMHLLAVWQFALLTAAMARHFRCKWPAYATLLSGLVFVDGLYIFPLRPATCEEVFGHWKNQPDSLCAALFCYAIRRYLMAMPTQRRAHTIDSKNQRIAHEPEETQRGIFAIAGIWFKSHRGSLETLGIFLLAVTAKEPGLIVLPLLCCLEIPHVCFGSRGQRRQAIIRLTPLLLSLPLVLLWRSHCIDNSVALRLLHPKAAWLGNICMNAFGPVLAAIRVRNWTVLGAGVSLAALILFAKSWYSGQRQPLAGRLWLVWIAAAAFLLVLAGLPEFGTEPDFRVRLTMVILGYLNVNQLLTITAMTAFVLGIWQLAWTYLIIVAFGFVWVELALVTTLPLQTLAYHYYLLEGGYAIIVGIGLLQLFPDQLRTRSLKPGQ